MFYLMILGGIALTWALVDLVNDDTDDDSGSDPAPEVSSTPNGSGLDVFGTSRSDLIEGTTGDDGLNGHGGDDTIRGDDGDDYVGGDYGDDLLDGGD
ncbi:MAG TPA: hypothetical protein ENK26_08745, partial [Gammaproteobacteria bacterium]|nr:hypothetical protein [Gammaproteobacteria bacterium]